MERRVEQAAAVCPNRLRQSEKPLAGRANQSAQLAGNGTGKPLDTAVTQRLKDLWGEENYTSQIQKQGNKPDFALFPNQTARSQAEKAKSYDDALAVIEAEKWDKDLDRKPGKNQESPHGQIRRYLTALPPVWGILTNGREWRLYNQNVKTAEKSWYGFNLVDIIERDDFDAFRRFFFLFEHAAFPGRLTAVQDASNRYVVAVNEGLRLQVFDALEALMTGWYEQDKTRGRTEERLRQLYNSGLVYLYRLLFLFYAESRHLLPLDNPVYQRDFSLAGLIQDYLVSNALDEMQPGQTYLFDRLQKFCS